MKRALSGFTLIELLVVIAIIAVLAAILFPVFARAREKARQSTCSSNQRQIAAAVQMYVQDHEETLPGTATVWSSINVDAGVLVCPTKGKTTPNGYVYSSANAGKANGAVDDPANEMLTSDGNATSPNAANVAYFASDIDPRHTGKAIQSFLDGHVETTANIPWQFQAYLWLMADKGVTATAGNVTAWADQSGNLNNATKTSTNAPYYDTTGSYPVVRFARNSVWSPSSYDADYLSFTRSTTIRTVVWVLKRRTEDGNYWGGTLLGDSTNYDFVGGTYLTSCLFEPTYASNSVKNGVTRLNGSVVTPTTTKIPSAMSVITLRTTGSCAANSFVHDRSYVTGEHNFYGDLAELMIFNVLLDDKAIGAIEGYCKKKYRL